MENKITIGNIENVLGYQYKNKGELLDIITREKLYTFNAQTLEHINTTELDVHERPVGVNGDFNYLTFERIVSTDALIQELTFLTETMGKSVRAWNLIVPIIALYLNPNVCDFLRVRHLTEEDATLNIYEGSIGEHQESLRVVLRSEENSVMLHDSHTRDSHVLLTKLEDDRIKILYKFAKWSHWYNDNNFNETTLVTDMLYLGYKLTKIDRLSTCLDKYNELQHLLPTSDLCFNDTPYNVLDLKQEVCHFLKFDGYGLDWNVDDKKVRLLQSLPNKLDDLRTSIKNLNTKLVYHCLPIVDDTTLYSVAKFLGYNDFMYNPDISVEEYFESVPRLADACTPTFYELISGKSGEEVISFNDFKNVVNVGTLNGIYTFDRDIEGNYIYSSFMERKINNIHDYELRGHELHFRYLKSLNKFEDIVEVLSLLTTHLKSYRQAWSKFYQEPGDLNNWLEALKKLSVSKENNDPCVIVRYTDVTETTIHKIMYQTASLTNCFTVKRTDTGEYIVDLEVDVNGEYLCQSSAFKTLLLNCGFTLSHSADYNGMPIYEMYSDKVLCVEYAPINNCQLYEVSDVTLIGGKRVEWVHLVYINEDFKHLEVYGEYFPPNNSYQANLTYMAMCYINEYSLAYVLMNIHDNQSRFQLMKLCNDRFPSVVFNQAECFAPTNVFEVPFDDIKDVSPPINDSLLDISLEELATKISIQFPNFLVLVGSNSKTLRVIDINMTDVVYLTSSRYIEKQGFNSNFIGASADVAEAFHAYLYKSYPYVRTLE